MDKARTKKNKRLQATGILRKKGKPLPSREKETGVWNRTIIKLE